MQSLIIVDPTKRVELPKGQSLQETTHFSELYVPMGHFSQVFEEVSLNSPGAVQFTGE